MVYTELVCLECGYPSFYAHFDRGVGNDSLAYLRLVCQQCKSFMHFTLDLTPEYKNRATENIQQNAL